MIGKVIAYFGTPRNPCLGGLLPSHGIENSRMKGKAVSLSPDVCVCPS